MNTSNAMITILVLCAAIGGVVLMWVMQSLQETKEKKAETLARQAMNEAEEVQTKQANDEFIVSLLCAGAAVTGVLVATTIAGTLGALSTSKDQQTSTVG